MKRLTASDVSEAIGDAATWFSVIELMVIDSTALLINQSDTKVGEIVCDPLSLSQTLALFIPLAKHKRPELLPKVKRACDAVQKVSAKRNDLLHSAWIFVDGYERVAQLRPRKRDRTLVPHTCGSLHRHITSLIAELRAVQEMWSELMDDLSKPQKA